MKQAWINPGTRHGFPRAAPGEQSTRNGSQSSSSKELRASNKGLACVARPDRPSSINACSNFCRSWSQGQTRKCIFRGLNCLAWRVRQHGTGGSAFRWRHCYPPSRPYLAWGNYWRGDRHRPNASRISASSLIANIRVAPEHCICSCGGRISCDRLYSLSVHAWQSVGRIGQGHRAQHRYLLVF